MKLKAYTYIGDDAESEITFANTAGQAKAEFAGTLAVFISTIAEECSKASECSQNCHEQCMNFPFYRDVKVHWCDYLEVQKWLESEVQENCQ